MLIQRDGVGCSAILGNTASFYFNLLTACLNCFLLSSYDLKRSKLAQHGDNKTTSPSVAMTLAFSTASSAEKASSILSTMEEKAFINFVLYTISDR